MKIEKVGLLVAECPYDAVGESQAFRRVSCFGHVDAVIEVLDSCIKFKGENLHARFEIEGEVVAHLNQFDCPEIPENLCFSLEKYKFDGAKIVLES